MGFLSKLLHLLFPTFWGSKIIYEDVEMGLSGNEVVLRSPSHITAIERLILMPLFRV